MGIGMREEGCGMRDLRSFMNLFDLHSYAQFLLVLLFDIIGIYEQFLTYFQNIGLVKPGFEGSKSLRK